MNQTRYISLDSTYRDRSKYPIAGEFEVIFSNSGMKDRFNAVDPICNSASEIVFNGYFNFNTPSSSLSGTIIATPTGVSPLVGNSSSQIEVFCQFTNTNVLSTIKNYYQGAVLFNTITKNRARILEYNLINNSSSGNSIGSFLLTDSIGTIENGNTISIVCPTDFTNSRIFVPNGIFMSNAYINHYLVNDTLSTSTSIVSAKITNYDINTKLLTADTSTWSSPLDSNVLSIRPELPIIGDLDSTSVTSNISFTLPASFTSYPLLGSFIRFVDATPTNIMKKIIKVDTSTSKPIIYVESSFPTTYAAGAKFQFLSFSRDNMVPLNYSGSIFSQQELSCYEIQLIDLILPNNVLDVAGGGLTSTYPYVYVGLTNTSASGYNNVIYSNNPYAKNMLFKIAIPNVNDPITTPFIRVINPNITQTIKFKPNDTLKFVVLVPTGEIFNTIEDDTMSPLAPLQAIQISAQFSIKKI